MALTLLVYDRTHSALLAAVTFAASVVPTFVGGITLSGLADRLPRRAVMIACDLIRVVLVVVMAVSGMPTAVLVVLLFLVTLIGAPFLSARAALYPDILPGDLYVLGTAVTITTLQFAQVVGFAVGGAVVGLFGVRTSLLVDAATFALSALITRMWVQVPAGRAGPGKPRAPGRGGVCVPGSGWCSAIRRCAPRCCSAGLPPSTTPPRGSPRRWRRRSAAERLRWGSSWRRRPWARRWERSRSAGSSPRPTRLRWMNPLAVAACGVLVLFVFRPPLPVALAVLGLSGLLDCFQLPANASFVSAAPPEQRSQAFGIAQGGMSLGQGLAMVVAGAAAERYHPS